MNADARDIEILTGVISRLEAELKTGPPKEREGRIQEVLEDARHLLDYMKDHVRERLQPTG